MNNYFKLSEDWKRIKLGDVIIPYGVGRVGRRIIPTLLNEFSFPFLLDKRREDDLFYGLKIKCIEEALEMIKQNGYKIVVTTMKGAYDEIARALSKYGLNENVDFCLFERFTMEWNLRWHEKCVLAKIDTVITSKCTLRCRNCNMFISRAVCQEDIPLEVLKSNFDVFFDSVDFVYEYTLIGGEPFLHRDILDILLYLEKQYGDCIGIINIITNGTIVPDNDIIEVLRKNKITVHISDYTASVPYEKRIDELTECFDKHGVEYYIIPNNTWKDVVYPNLSYTSENPKEHMLICGHSTHSVDFGKIYWCDPAFAAEYFMGFESKSDDYLDLKKNKRENTRFDASLKIMKYLLGNVNPRGYMSICEKCAGIGRDNNSVVVAGEQD